MPPFIYNISDFLEQFPAHYDEEADYTLSNIINTFANDQKPIHTVDRPVNPNTQTPDPMLTAFYSASNYVSATRIGLLGFSPVEIEVHIYEDVLNQVQTRGYAATAESLKNYIKESLEMQKSWLNRLEKATIAPSIGLPSRR